MTYHCKDECEEIDRDRVEVAAILDTIRFSVFKERVSKDVHDNTIFTEAYNLHLVLRLC